MFSLSPSISIGHSLSSLIKTKAYNFLLSSKPFCILHSFLTQPTLVSLSGLVYLLLKFSTFFHFKTPHFHILLRIKCFHSRVVVSNGFSLEVYFFFLKNLKSKKKGVCLLFPFVVLSLCMDKI